MSDKTEKFNRVRYIRGLERFAIAVVKAIKRDDFDEAKFIAVIEKNYRLLNKIEPVFLDQPYTKALCEFVNLCLKNGVNKDEILKSANHLDRLKNSKNYKKDKHKNSDIWED